MAKRGRGQPTKLTPDLIEKLAAGIAGGLRPSVIADLAGATERSYYSWLERGEKEWDRIDAARTQEAEEPKETEKIFLQFFQAIKAARHNYEATALAQIRDAARGGKEFQTKRIVKRVPLTIKGTVQQDGDGQIIYIEEEHTEHVMTLPAWQAAAWELERMDPSRYGRVNRMDPVLEANADASTVSLDEYEKGRKAREKLVVKAEFAESLFEEVKT